jgi:hypothetical protein
VLRVLGALGALLLGFSAANAAPDQAFCGALQAPTRGILMSAAETKAAIDKLGTHTPKATLELAGSGAEPALVQFEAKRVALAAALNGFLESGDRFTAELQKCAR